MFDNSLREGEYTSQSNVEKYIHAVDSGNKFEIQIRYNRKIDGIIA